MNGFAPPTACVTLTILLSGIAVSTASADPIVVGYELVASKRVSRTVFDYTYRVSVRNDESPRANVTAYVSSRTAATTIVDEDVYVGFMEPTTTIKPLNTFTLRQDRTRRFSQSDLSWRFEGDLATVDDRPISLSSVQFVERRGRLVHDGLFPLSGQPQVGKRLVLIELTRRAKSVTILLVDPSDAVLHSVSGAEFLDTDYIRGDYTAVVDVPAVPFRVRVEGQDDLGRNFVHTFSDAFEPSPLKVEFPANQVIVPGSGSFPLSLRVSNAGLACRCTLTVSADRGDVEPSPSVMEIVLAAGETREQAITVTVPDIEMLRATPARLTADLRDPDGTVSLNSATAVVVSAD